ncbi:Type VIII secretion system, CsgF [uncultured Caudovirales phage]|uniref:Type VIII secretion system, CsgF n=1 Tax=uncultured Caudovirales phage TaxID=2100421 RepID=A0A6J5KV49_9CAUD|nr:Type VIII secretion system, CsgF [uncultured Caudovirales phage]CAB5208707.1 Type VIII secretion system, CsgF [uncultured Caudovirales phage]
MSKSILALLVALLPLGVSATQIADYSFKSPAFNGNGYGTYVLTIENQQYTRSQAILSALESAKQAAAADAKNKPINQFLTNLESRIYAQISQNVATQMFAGGACSTGSNVCGGKIDFQGNTLSWIKDPVNPTNILLTVRDNAGNSTVINVPLNSFNMN